MSERRETCLWLAELAGLHSGTLRRLVKEYGTIAQAIDRPRDDLAGTLARSRVADRRKVLEGAPTGGVAPGADGGEGHTEDAPVGERAAWQAALLRRAPLEAAIAAEGGGLVCAYTDDLYPARLRDLKEPPTAVFVAATADAETITVRLRLLAKRPCVAVVGTRRPSAYGIDMASFVAADLAREGVVVVSGLALGVDGAAHRAALDRAADDELATVSVVAGGADVCTPASHRALRERVLEHGLVLSEFVWGAGARAWHFPRRNRVMAALSDAVIVVEGTAKSGALITARHAELLERPRLAVPGECGRALTEGPHALLRRGAGLCESAASVRATLARVEEERPGILRDPVRDWLERERRPDGRRSRPAVTAPARASLPPAERALLAALEHAPAGLDRLIETSGLAPSATLAAVASLEVAGIVRIGDGGIYRPVRGALPGGAPESR